MRIIFRKDQIDSKLIQYKGIYSLYAIFKDGEIIYIGSTKNIYKRMKEHKYQKDFDSFEVIFFDSGYKCKLAERTSIFHHKPESNGLCKNRLSVPDMRKSTKGKNNFGIDHLRLIQAKALRR